MDTVTSLTSKSTQYEIGDAKARKEKLDRSELPTKLSAFQNDVGFITKTVNNLSNYYKKSQTYSRDEIQNLLSARLTIQVVEELPTHDISTTTIYFVPRPKTEQEQDDYYNEYIYTGTWELIGNTFVDLSNYYIKSETNEQIDSKVAVETQARTNADRTLQNNINGVQSNLNATNTNLNSEILTREQNDLRHTNSISTLTTGLSNEITRATNAENTLSDRVDVAESHIANKSNPHNVTKSQVGLGNVTNVSTTSTIESGSNKNITSGAVFTALAEKVDKVEGKGLSDQNFTYAEKTKLAGLSNYNDTSLKNRVTATENAITTLNGNSSVSGSVDKKIADAIAGVTQIDFQIVSALPSSGVKGVIYFVQSGVSEQGNIYDEYVWLTNKWELLSRSSLSVDLDDYYKKAQVDALVSVKNNKITISNYTSTLSDNDTFLSGDAGTNPTSMKRISLTSLWAYVSSKMSILYSLVLDDSDFEEIIA